MTLPLVAWISCKTCPGLHAPEEFEFKDRAKTTRKDRCIKCVKDAVRAQRIKFRKENHEHMREIEKRSKKKLRLKKKGWDIGT